MIIPWGHDRPLPCRNPDGERATCCLSGKPGLVPYALASAALERLGLYRTRRLVAMREGA